MIEYVALSSRRHFKFFFLPKFVHSEGNFSERYKLTSIRLSVEFWWNISEKWHDTLTLLTSNLGRVNLALCSTNYALRHEGVSGSGCIDPHFLQSVVCSYLLMLVFCSQNLLLWRWRPYDPPKCRFTQNLHGVTSQKTAFFIVTAVKTSNLTTHFLDLGTWWRWAVSFTPRPLYPWWKRTRYPSVRRLGGLQNPDSNSNTSVVKPVTSRYTDYATPAPSYKYCLVFYSVQLVIMDTLRVI
jgi:hypothetical protein